MGSSESCEQQDDAANNHDACYILCTVTEISLDLILNKNPEWSTKLQGVQKIGNIYASSHAGNLKLNLTSD